MASPLVSCVVPVYNGERYLAETLDSILGQTHEPLEVLIVDDGSTDGTRAIAEEYGEKVRYVFQENASHTARGHNPVCGDELNVYLRIDDGIVRDDEDHIQGGKTL